MPVTQLSKIQLRRGPQTELDTGTLSSGELGYATDTGRLFIGSDPARSGPWTGRSILPYGSVEVLTETSTEAFARLFDRMNRSSGPTGMSDGVTGRRPSLEAQLERNISTWTQVSAFAYDNNSVQQSTRENIILSTSRSMAAIIEYTVFDGTNVLRSGTIRTAHDGNSSVDEAGLTDEYTLNMATLSAASPLLAADVFDAGVRFRVIRVGSSPNYTYRLQYQNPLSSVLRVQFRIQVAAKLS